MPSSVHIFALSRLVHASPSNWEKTLNAIELGKDRAFRFYLPLREAIAKFAKNPANGSEAIVAEMVARARAAGGNKVAAANERAFREFEASFLPRDRAFRRDFLRDDHLGAEFGGLLLKGRPHLSVADHVGAERFVFLHAADWKDEDLQSYLHLLSVVVKFRFGAEPESIWCMNLRTGRDERFRPGPRLASKCERAARLYARLIAALESER